jgi:hypothetical protein
MLKRDLLSLQGQLSIAMLSGNQSKIRSLQGHVIRKQNEIREKEYSWSQTSGDGGSPPAAVTGGVPMVGR